jgi:hypothetical protein
VLATPPKFPGLVFATPLRGADGRDELVVITRTDEPTLRTWWITAFHFEGTRLVRTVDATQLYQLSNANARWIGADLHDVDLYLELTSRPDGIDVGGLLTTPGATKPAGGAPAKIRDVVVISPASVNRRRGKPTAGEASDAGVAGPSPAAGAQSSAPVSAGTPSTNGGASARPTPDAAVDATDPAGAEPVPNKP